MVKHSNIPCEADFCHKDIIIFFIYFLDSTIRKIYTIFCTKSKTISSAQSYPDNTSNQIIYMYVKGHTEAVSCLELIPGTAAANGGPAGENIHLSMKIFIHIFFLFICV
jgi:hypothetical protein